MELGILNVGAGDTKISFDPTKPEELERSKRIVTDMLRRGFVILIQVGETELDGRKEPTYVRVKEFRAETCEYIIADDQPEKPHGEASEDQRSDTAARPRGRPRGSTRAVHASAARGVAVGRTAGG